MHGLYVLLLRAGKRGPASSLRGPTRPSSRHLEPSLDAEEAVSVLVLTVFIGVVLVLFFVIMFLRDVADPRGSSERDALLPLAAEMPLTFETARHKTTHHPQNPYAE